MSFSISNHALARYATRYQGTVLTDNNVQQFKSRNPEEAKAFEQSLLRDTEKAIFIAEANFEKFPKSRFYINTETMMTFVVSQENCIVTCYPIDYGLEEDMNREMLSILIKNKMLLEDKLSETKNNNAVEISKLETQIADFKVDLENLNTQIEIIKASKKLREDTINVLKQQQQSIDSQIKVAVEKIVRSKNAF